MCCMTVNSMSIVPAGHVTTMLAALPWILHSASTTALSPYTTLHGGASAAMPFMCPRFLTRASRGSLASTPRLIDRSVPPSAKAWRRGPLAAARARWAETASCSAAREARGQGEDG
ncbi:hypothetical protein PVAP13_9KG261526 [Panicum virgatum]|uniref:Uncharacterized protein n=1 Tax=Panicum virgatum TaxID=38727 RepID=A0A8T0NK47_PANVG|nr:hypothetical protein PVAP13_9KG261526 [Panicum virgatum]